MPQHFDPQQHADAMVRSQDQTPEQRQRMMAAARNTFAPRPSGESLSVTVGMRELRGLGVVGEAHTKAYGRESDHPIVLTAGSDYPKALLNRPSQMAVLAGFAFFFVAGWLIGAFG